jgi:hypothetical protein
MARLIDSENHVKDIEKRGMRCIEIDFANVVTLCWPIDTIVVFYIQLLLLGEDNSPETGREYLPHEVTL